MKEYAPFYHTFSEKARRPVRIDKQQFWTKKDSNPDSNPACMDRMPLLYHLRHHHCPEWKQCLNGPRIFYHGAYLGSNHTTKAKFGLLILFQGLQLFQEPYKMCSDNVEPGLRFGEIIKNNAWVFTDIDTSIEASQKSSPCHWSQAHTGYILYSS